MKAIILILMIVATLPAKARVVSEKTTFNSGLYSTGNFETSGTDKHSIPCPKMTEVQRDALASPQDGWCIYNTTKGVQNVYSSAAGKWKAGGGGAGGSRLNLLTDGSFEDGVTEGSCGANCVATQESSVIMATPNNEKALKLVFSGVGCYTVDKTTSANYANVQGAVSAWIQSNLAGVTFTSRRNGADTTNVLNVDADSIYRNYEIPDITGSASFGFKVCGVNGATVYVDETFAGPAKVTGVLSSVKTGSLTVPITTNCQRTVSSTSFASFAVDADCPTPTVVNSSLLSAPATNIPAVVIRPNSALTYDIEITGFIRVGASTTSANCAFEWYDGTNSYPMGVVGGGASGTTAQLNYTSTMSGRIELTSPITTDRQFQLRAKGDAAGTSCSLYNADAATKISVTAYEGSSSTYSASNKDTDWIACTPNATYNQGLGTLGTTNLKCKRKGSDLLIRGLVTVGTTTASIARLGIPQFNGQTLTTSSNVTQFEEAGIVKIPSGTTLYERNVIIAPSFNYVNFSTTGTASSGLSAAQGSDVAVSSSQISIRASIPIEGWDNSNVITASFKEVPTMPGITSPKICKYAFGGSSSTLSSPSICSTGVCAEVFDSCGSATPPTRTATGKYQTVTWASGTWSNSSFIDCECKAFTSVSDAGRDCAISFVTGTSDTWSTNASGGFSAATRVTDSAGTVQDAYIVLTCEGQSL